MVRKIVKQYLVIDSDGFQREIYPSKKDAKEACQPRDAIFEITNCWIAYSPPALICGFHQRFPIGD